MRRIESAPIIPKSEFSDHTFTILHELNLRLCKITEDNEFSSGTQAGLDRLTKQHDELMLWLGSQIETIYQCTNRCHTCHSPIFKDSTSCEHCGASDIEP